MLATMAMIYFWETRGREQFLYSSVVVLNQSVEANVSIKSSMLGLIKINPNTLIEGAIVQKEKIIGKYSAHYIPKNSQLAPAYFKDDTTDIKKEDQYIFAIPTDWIITFPNSLRRGDMIYFYPVKIVDKNEQQNKSFNNLDNIKITSQSDLLKSKVAYLKDSGNREVVNTPGEDRYDGSANIASIEIVTNYEGVSYLQNLAESNWKFIILYKGSVN